MSCFLRSTVLLLIGLLVAPSYAVQNQEQIFYKMISEKALKVKDDLNGKEYEHIFVLGTSVLWIEQQVDGQGQVWFRLGLDSENFIVIDEEGTSNDPSQVWVRAEDFYQLELIEETIFRVTYCYRYVKKYLLKKGFVETYLPGASAYMAATILPKYGFTKSTRTPSQAKTYDVCVYKGGPSGHGHIEVRDPQGWYYGYGYKRQPIQNRTFLGCFFKLLKN